MKKLIAIILAALAALGVIQKEPEKAPEEAPVIVQEVVETPKVTEVIETPEVTAPPVQEYKAPAPPAPIDGTDVFLGDL